MTLVLLQVGSTGKMQTEPLPLLVEKAIYVLKSEDAGALLETHGRRWWVCSEPGAFQQINRKLRLRWKGVLYCAREEICPLPFDLSFKVAVATCQEQHSTREPSLVSAI